MSENKGRSAIEYILILAIVLIVMYMFVKKPMEGHSMNYSGSTTTHSIC